MKVERQSILASSLQTQFYKALPESFTDQKEQRLLVEEVVAVGEVVEVEVVEVEGAVVEGNLSRDT